MVSETDHYPFPLWKQIIKRLFDLVMAGGGLILLSPVLLLIAFKVKRSSKGPVLYFQERVGFRGKPFYIIKFRSMFSGAEAGGPRLSGPDDDRITPWGKVMRRWKLDELPQLWNVLTGEMSLVGPRPEREFYIRHLRDLQQPVDLLLQVRPGMTSLGIVRFGYASTLEEMMDRLPFDLSYVQHRSLMLDLSILRDTLRLLFLPKEHRK